jgi:hypothetical protein
MLSGSGQKGNAISCSACVTRSTRIIRIAGVLAGTNPRVSSMRNTVSPMSRFRGEADELARVVVGVAGRGERRKRKRLGNRVDRGCVDRDNITLLRKQAHFRLVIHDERVCRTASRGNRK